MGYSNSRGQGALEGVLVMLVLSAFVLTAMQFSKMSRRFLPAQQLSKERP